MLARVLYPAGQGAAAPVAAFGSPTPPAPPPPQPIPDPLDPALLAKKRTALDASVSRSGRNSTDLTGDGGTYGTDKLGMR